MTNSVAVVFEGPRQLAVRPLTLHSTDPTEVLVQVEWSGISTGTERLLYTGEMPPFPGLGYPLVPGYETVGRVVEPDAEGTLAVGQRVFIPGAKCFGEVRGLFGGAASRLRVPAARVTPIDDALALDGGAEAVLLALAATAEHALVGGPELPDLIVGHGVLGRLLARLAQARGGTPTVWEKNPARAEGATGYPVLDPEADERRDYRVICDVSGDPRLLDTLIGRLAKGGEIVLAGFYKDKLAFTFPLAFMKEARLRIAAEWQPDDLTAVLARLSDGSLDLAGLITHRRSYEDAPTAYETAFGDPDCLKMILDWRSCQ
jgi:bacteriochlorophyllide a dehydrogenase